MKTKILLTLILIIVLFASTAIAKPVVTADRTYFDVESGLYVLNGNVYIEANNRIITAGQAKVNMASLEVWGSGGVTVTQEDIKFTGDSVYVYGSQERAVIDGGVGFSRTGLRITANKVEYNWNNKSAIFNGNVQVTQNNNTWAADSLSYNVAANSIL